MIRVTTLRGQIFKVEGGAVRVTTLRAMAHLNDFTRGIRVTTLRAVAHASDKTNGVRASTFRLNAWATLEQSFYMGIEPFGSHEVFAPDLSFDIVVDSPPPPVIEVNPYQAATPNIDLQRILREQHNTTQAGDSTFHWGVLTEIYNEPLYNLGSLGRFYHDELGIVLARYCRFVDFNPTEAKAVPVGLKHPQVQPWTVTNQLTLSTADSLMGVAMVYTDEVNIGTWYGWVITQGFVPAELYVNPTNESFGFGTQYGWSKSGEVKQNVVGDSLGWRSIVGGNLRLLPGSFMVDVDRFSITKALGLINATMAPTVAKVAKLITDMAALTGVVDGHTVEIGAINTRHTEFQSFMTKEIKSLADALLAIRSLMPDTNFKVYVDTSITALRGYVDTQINLVGGVANAGLARANAAYALAQSISYDGIQVQINALNNAMGGITNRIIGFNTTIDTNTLTAGQTLVSYLVSTDAFGVNYYDFRPVNFKTSALTDVDWTTPPTDGQVLIWDSATSKFIPGDMTGGGGGGGGDGTWHGARIQGGGSAQAVAVAAIVVVTNMTTIAANTDGFTTTGSQIVIPAGVDKIRIRAQVQVDTVTAGSGMNAIVRINGVNHAQALYASGYTNPSIQVISRVRDVVAGDIIDLMIQSQDSAYNIAASSNTYLEVTVLEGSVLGGIGDAPSDGKTYGRKDAVWVETPKGRAALLSHYTRTGTLASAGTALQVLATVTIPTAVLKNGDFFSAEGLFSNNNPASKARGRRIQWSDGTNTYASGINDTSSTVGNPTMIRHKFFRVSATQALWITDIDFQNGAMGAFVNGSGWGKNATLVTFDWTQPLVVSFTGTITTGTPANNDIALEFATVELILGP